MDNTNNIIEIKKEYTKNSIRKNIYYALIIIILVIGFLIKFTDSNYNIKENVYWYSIKLVDFSYETSKWTDLKNICNGYYTTRILQIITSFIFLCYLPYVIKELKNKIFNNSNLFVIDNKLKGTYSKFFKMKEFELDIKDIKYCNVKNVKFKYMYGNKKLNIYTNQEKYSVYYIQDFENTKEMIDKIAVENNVIYEKDVIKNRIRNKIKSFCSIINMILDEVSDNIASKAESKKSKSIEEKLDEIKKLKSEEKINDSEYEILRKEILKNYK